eukprot:765779-Hanusia_phi.AAC.1
MASRMFRAMLSCLVLAVLSTSCTGYLLNAPLAPGRIGSSRCSRMRGLPTARAPRLSLSNSLVMRRKRKGDQRSRWETRHVSDSVHAPQPAVEDADQGQTRAAKIEALAARRQSGLIVVLEDASDAHNAGAVIRSCDAREQACGRTWSQGARSTPSPTRSMKLAPQQAGAMMGRGGERGA